MDSAFPVSFIPESEERRSTVYRYSEAPHHGQFNRQSFVNSGDFSSIAAHLEDHFGFSAALANYQPCDDCTPATKTEIPHHHHPSGRLAGASATLDGHFCCSWLVHDQLCFLCFDSAEALDNHIKNDHAGKDGTYTCLWQDCAKHDTSTNAIGSMNFGNKPKLMRHVHSHTGYKPFPCTFPGCDKGFVTREQLKNHETTHTKTRKYKCEFCGKAFAVKSALTTHITAVHDEKKIHTCDICGKAFADSSNLSKHKQTHYRESTGVKKQRSRRATASKHTTTSDSPEIAGHCMDPPLPLVQGQHSNHNLTPSEPAAPLAGKAPKLALPSFFSTTTPPSFCTPSSICSPPASRFDPNCYCCDQACSPPAGPVTPCNETDECDLEGFCDLPECLGEAEASCNMAVSSPQASTLSCATCCDEDALSSGQVEQLRNYQMHPSLHWDPQQHYQDYFHIRGE